MAERQLTQILTQLKTQFSALSYPEAASLLSKAKLLLLQLNALTPPTSTSSTPPHKAPSTSVLALARETYERGAMVSIRARDSDAFTRYVAQLAPFYALPAAVLPPAAAERNKVTGLYLLLLLTQGRYAEFHSELEALAMREGLGRPGDAVETDRYLGYPVRLERWLMEGSYDRVWKAMKQGEVPCEEYGVFSEVCLLLRACGPLDHSSWTDSLIRFQILTSQIRSEIASCSERAYPSLPLSSTKSLLFLESEGAVVDFARQRGWTIKNGQIFFPSAEAAAGEEPDEEKDFSRVAIQNTLGYARELETIV